MSMFCLLLPLGSGIGNDKFNFFRPGNDILNMFVDLGMINSIICRLGNDILNIFVDLGMTY